MRRSKDYTRDELPIKELSDNAKKALIVSVKLLMTLNTSDNIEYAATLINAEAINDTECISFYLNELKHYIDKLLKEINS